MRSGILLMGIALLALTGLVAMERGLLSGSTGTAFAHEADCDTLNPAVTYDAPNDECDLNVAIVTNGVAAVGHSLHLGPAGKITTTAGVTLNINGDLEIDTPSGATGTNGINGDVVNVNGLPININASGNVVLHGNGTKGARITSSRTGLGDGGDGGGNITIKAGARDANGVCLTPPSGFITMEPGSEVLANTSKYGAGDIIMNACRGMEIDGLVESKSGQTGAGNVATQTPGGGPIWLDAGCDLSISDTGKVSSEGLDPGSDLVHLGAGCTVVIHGLVQSIGAGHAQPANPHNHCDNFAGNIPPNHPDKPADATGCVEVWSGGTIVIDSLNHNGQVNADKLAGCSNYKVSWIDLYARLDIQVIGDSVKPFAVHADSCASSDQTGGIITVKSTTGKVIASLLAFSASGAVSNGGDGGSIIVHSKLDALLDTASLIASGRDVSDPGSPGLGGSIVVQSFSEKVSWTVGVGDVRPNSSGTIAITACKTISIGGTNFNGETPLETPLTCATGPDVPTYVILPSCVCGPTSDCPTCDGTTVVVDGDVRIDFNPATPTCDDGPTDDLCNFFFADKSGGATADKWKAVFNVGPKKLIIKDNASVYTVPVGTGSNRKTPGIQIIGSCELEIEGDIDGNGKPGSVLVTSQNQQAGDIVLKFDGNITINGVVKNEVIGTLGRPGKITIASCCGDIVTGPKSRIETIGVDPGGNDINIVTCCTRGYAGTGGDIVLTGLVRAVHKTGITPTINIVAFVGAVSIDGNTDLGDVPGTSLRRTSGVLVETLNSTNGGDINIQAFDDVTVSGNKILFTNKTNYGAVAIKTNNTNGQGGNGTMRVLSLTGDIIASDRAFDFANRFNHAADTFIILHAAGDVRLSVTAAINAGAADNTKAVVSSQGGAGGQGGTNRLQAFQGQLNIGAKAQVLANAPGGSNGVNDLKGCGPALLNGIILPPDANAGDNSGTCGGAPTALYTDCAQLGVSFTQDQCINCRS